MNHLETTADELVSLSRSKRVECLFKFESFKYQFNMLDSDARRLTWVCGRHVGKTETASVVPADYALTHADADVLIAARFQETSDELFRRTKQHLSALGSLPEIGVTSPNSQTDESDNGARIMSRTLGHDARQQRGKSPSVSLLRKRPSWIATYSTRCSARCLPPTTTMSCGSLARRAGDLAVSAISMCTQTAERRTGDVQRDTEAHPHR